MAIAAASEYALQRAVIDWWALAHHTYRVPVHMLYAIPNGAFLAGDARRRAMQMHKLKVSGLRPGIPDLFLAVPRFDIDAGGLYLEMKREGGRLSVVQKDVIDSLRRGGYHACFCFSSEEAIRAITGYLRNRVS